MTGTTTYVYQWKQTSYYINAQTPTTSLYQTFTFHHPEARIPRILLQYTTVVTYCHRVTDAPTPNNPERYEASYNLAQYNMIR